MKPLSFVIITAFWARAASKISIAFASRSDRSRRATASNGCYNLGQSLALPHDPTYPRSPRSAAVVADADGASVGGQV